MAATRPVFSPRLEPQQSKRKGDIFIDVVEKLYATISKEGKVLNFRLSGVINLKSCMESQVNITLGFNENLVLSNSLHSDAPYSTDVVLSNYILHESVNSQNFEKDHTLAVCSAQGEIPVLKYQSMSLPFNGLPFSISTAVEEVANSRDIELTVKLRCEGNPASEAIDTVVQIPVPSGTSNLMKRFNELDQTAELQRDPKKIVWKIKKLGSKSEALAKFRLAHANDGPSSKLQLGPLAATFELSNQSTSGLKIRFLKMDQHSAPNGNVQRWIRYVTTSDSWVQRLA